MKTLPAKHQRLFRYHSLLMVIFLILLGWLLLRYLAIMQVYVERLNFENNLRALEQTLIIAKLLQSSNPDACAALNDPNLFQKLTFKEENLNVKLIGESSPITPQWQYDAKRQQLIYHVKSPERYFRAPQGKHIVISFICEDNTPTYRISDHQWCEKMNIFYCSEWK